MGVGPDEGRLFHRCDGHWAGTPGILRCGHRLGYFRSRRHGGEMVVWGSFPPWLLIWVHWLTCAAVAWVLVLRAARRAEGRELGWGELGWALAVGLPPAALCWAFVGWASGAPTWEDLFRHTSGLLGWQTSLTLTVSGLVFLAAWGLSRPRRAADDAAG